MTDTPKQAKREPWERPGKPGRPRKPTLTGPQFQQVTIALEPATIAAVEEEARRRGISSRSDAIRRAVHEWLRRAEKRRTRPAANGGQAHDHGEDSDE
jgi:Arc/MetJ-type ribon-helix-helix transcriptional regulator